jgi:hypothetical protein
MIARTVENEQAILNAVEEGDTRSIEEIARLLGISSRAGAKSRDTRGESENKTKR